MGLAPQNFDGISTVIPGIYTKSEFPLANGSVRAAVNNVVILGECCGGVPYNANVDDSAKLNLITSVSQAVRELRGGPAYYMTEFFLSPTKDPKLAKPSKVEVIRVNPASRSFNTIKNSAGKDVIELISNRYGTVSKQLCRKIESGTVKGKKITIKFQGQNIFSKDNIGQDCFEIQYLGTGTTALLSIDSTHLQVIVTGAVDDNINLSFSDYPTVGQIVSQIGDKAVYSCNLKGKSDFSSEILDVVTNKDIKNAVICTAEIEAVIQMINNNSGGEVMAQLCADVLRSDIVNDNEFVFFNGGSENSATPADWAGALDLLKKFTVNHILVASGDLSVQSMVANHVEEMSSMLNKKRRTASTGAGNNLVTKISRIDSMKALNSARMEYCCSPFDRFDLINGNTLRRFEPFYGAALVSGIKYANNITMSATFKNINVLGIGEDLSREDVEEYILAGATLFEKNERGITITHNVTTYQGSNLILNLPSMLRTADFIDSDSELKIQARLADMNKAPDPMIIKTLMNYLVTNLLPGYVYDGLLTDDPISGAKAISDVFFNMKGDRFDYGFTGIIAAPLHYVYQKHSFIITGQNS